MNYDVAHVRARGERKINIVIGGVDVMWGEAMGFVD